MPSDNETLLKDILTNIRKTMGDNSNKQTRYTIKKDDMDNYVLIDTKNPDEKISVVSFTKSIYGDFICVTLPDNEDANNVIAGLNEQKDQIEEFQKEAQEQYFKYKDAGDCPEKKEEALMHNHPNYLSSCMNLNFMMCRLLAKQYTAPNFDEVKINQHRYNAENGHLNECHEFLTIQFPDGNKFFVDPWLDLITDKQSGCDVAQAEEAEELDLEHYPVHVEQQININGIKDKNGYERLIYTAHLEERPITDFKKTTLPLKSFLSEEEQQARAIKRVSSISESPTLFNIGAITSGAITAVEEPELPPPSSVP